MGSTFDLLLVASMPVLKFLFITVVGLFLALKRIDILGEGARHHLNQIVYYVFGPALVVSYLAQTVTLKSFLSMWFMPLNILLTFMLGSALGWVLGKVADAPKHIKGLAVASCSAGNLGALPIIIIPAMCQQTGSPFGAADVCKKYGLAYASLSMAVGSIYIWLYTYNILRVFSNNGLEDTHTNGCADDKVPDGGTSVTIPKAEPVDGKTSVDDIEDPTSMHQSLAASKDSFSNAKLVIALSFRIRQCLRTTLRKINLKAIFIPSTVAAIVGFFIGMIPTVSKLLYGHDAPLHVIGDTASMIGDAAVPSITLILGANLLKGLKGSGVQVTVLVGVIIVRYLLLPLLGILVVKGVVRAGFVQSHDLLFQFVLLLQYALPPALAIGTITQLFGAGQSECSAIMLWSYVVAPVTLTLWSTLFLWLIA